ncbi:MAG: hypothetical protein GY818_04715, partial [Planctomycetaceae bacterium]|nr:hypothetical protein [Planctomycetaceae bacterium]
MNNNNDHNNNNHYTRLGSYDEPDNICYGSQAEPNTRYGSYPDTNSMNIRYGVEGGRYSCSTDEMESVRFGSQSYSPDYSPRPGHRDHFRENFRDGPRNDYHQRRSSVSDYYQQRSMVPQDRYPGVIGYSGPDTPSRFNYPRFDFPARNFGMNRGDYMKSENVYRNHSQYETRNEFVKPNESVIRSPADFVNKNECAGIKSTESRSAPARNSFVPKTAPDEFVKPTYTRSDFVARQNTNDSELQHKIEKPLPVNANAGRFPQSENSHFNGVTKVENKDDEAKPDSPTRKSQPKT